MTVWESQNCAAVMYMSFQSHAWLSTCRLSQKCRRSCQVQNYICTMYKDSHYCKRDLTTQWQIYNTSRTGDFSKMVWVTKMWPNCRTSANTEDSQIQIHPKMRPKAAKLRYWLAVSTHPFPKIFTNLKFNCPPMGQRVSTWSDIVHLELHECRWAKWRARTLCQFLLLWLLQGLDMDNKLGHKCPEKRWMGHAL